MKWRIGHDVLTPGLFVIICTVNGCRGPAKPMPTSDVRAVLTRLCQEPLEGLPSELGTPVAVENSQTDAILANGTAAVPTLVAAIDDANSRCVGYAAFCLRKLRAVDGVPEATVRVKSLLEKTKPTSDDRFAIGELRQYIESVAGVRSK
jgi:hypothetical protein